jgi:hypothetical protein
MGHAQHSSAPPLGSSYGFHCVLENVGFDQAVTRVTKALMAEGFALTALASAAVQRN